MTFGQAIGRKKMIDGLPEIYFPSPVNGCNVLKLI